MDQPDKAPTPDDAGLTVPNEEVERLLSEAQSLVTEISGQLGMAAPDETPSPLPTPMPAEADPLTAVEMATVQVETLEAALEGSADCTGEANESAPAVAQATVVGNEVAPHKDVQCEATQRSEKKPDAAPAMVGAGEAVVNQAAAATSESRGTPRDAVESSGNAPTCSESIKPEVLRQLETHVLLDSGEGALTDKKSTGRRARRRLRQAAGIVAVMLRNIAVSLVNWLVRFITMLDAPFARLSLNTKTALGLIGLVSLLTGAFALLAPRLLSHNPYAAMPLNNG